MRCYDLLIIIKFTRFFHHPRFILALFPECKKDYIDSTLSTTSNVLNFNNSKLILAVIFQIFYNRYFSNIFDRYFSNNFDRYFSNIF